MGANRLEEIVRALLAPPILWRDPASGKDIASRFMSRAMADGRPELCKIRESGFQSASKIGSDALLMMSTISSR